MSDKTPAPAVPSATIMMLRKEEAGLEVFMVVRHHQIDFASGALVFPGGKADPQDFDTDLIPHLDGADQDANMRAIQVSAIREAFEECGILLARAEGEEGLIDAERLLTLEGYRTTLHSGEVSLKDFVEKERLRLACDQLVHFSHWVTPTMLPKRFDTHFFLAVAPEDHLAVHDGHESVDSVWITPAEVLEGATSGKYTVIFPTLRNVEMLGESDTVEAAIAATKGREIMTVLPWSEQREDGNYICIPAEAGYKVTEEKMPDRG